MHDYLNAPETEPESRFDRGLVVLLVVLAFLLGWVELFDPDVWWHIRTGQLILERSVVPRLDPFSFASTDRSWIDLHWGFQVLLASVHARAGVAGILLAAATACAMTVLVALTARSSGWPGWVAAWCWVPTLLAMSARFDPRPEMLSLMGLAAMLAVLLRVDRSPAWAWALPVLVACWVNVHSLFILGPLLIGCHALGALLGPKDQRGRAYWRHFGPAAVLAMVACLANPYGWRGAVFPLELMGKIADPTNPYKNHVLELMSPAARVKLEGVESVAGRIYLQSLAFLMMMIPPSFAIPAAWRRWRADRPGTSARPGVWVGGAVLLVALVAIDVIGLPGPSFPPRSVQLCGAVPLLLALAGLGLATGLALSSRRAGAVLGMGMLATAAWVDFLRTHLFGMASAWGDRVQPTGFLGLAPVAVLLILAAVLTQRGGASLFRVLAASTFTYLGLAADRNANLSALVVGTVLSWNWAEWAAAVNREGGTAKLRLLATAARVGLGLLLVGWGGLIVTDRFYPLVGYDLHFGLRERPLTYAHESARFAGGPGLPDRALVYSMQQTGVYLYHNGPTRKIFMDGRLEVPAPATFRAYLAIEDSLKRGDPHWVEAVRSWGNPLILIDHAAHERAEAAILTDPGWRCLHFDPMAAVYVARTPTGSDSRHPTVDFAAQHFGLVATRARPADAGEDLAEARALLAIGTVLVRGEPTARTRGIGATLLAQDRAMRTLSTRGDWTGSWTVLGHAARILPPSGFGRPVGPEEPWDPVRGLGLSQSAYAYRKALAFDPDDRVARLALGKTFEASRMLEARDGLDSNPAKRGDQGAPTTGLDRVADPSRLLATIEGLLRKGRTEDIARFAAGTEGEEWPWPVAERLAATAMHLGYPGLARKIWERAGSPPSPGLRLARLGDSLFASWEFDLAAGCYARALAVDGDLAVAHVGLTLTRFRQGRVAETRDTCRAALTRELNPMQRGLLTLIAQLSR